MNASAVGTRRAPVWIAAASVAVPSAALAALAASTALGGADTLPLALAVAILSLAALLRPIEPMPGEKLSLAAAVAFFAVLVLPAGQAIAALVVAELAARALRRTSPVSTAVNVAKSAGAAGAAAAAVAALRLSPLVAPDVEEVAVAGGLYVVAALAPVAAMIGWTQGAAAVRGFLAREWLSTATLVAIGAVGAVVWAAMPLLLFLLALPLAMVEVAARASARAREAHAAVARALDTQRTFVADAAHELRNPLAAIRGNLAFIREPALARDEAEALADARRDLGGLADLVDRLLLLSRADANAGTGSADLAAVTRAVASATPLRDGVSLEMDLPERVDVAAPRELVESVVRDLVGNAAAYTERGFVRVSVRARGREALLEVRDTGIGIAPAELPRVFDRFFRGTAARRLAPGSGLGLAIARRVAEAYGGTVTIGPATGGGTAAYAVLPRALRADG